jgi:hypothetical protein
MKTLLGIALGAAVIYFTLKVTAQRGRTVPTLRPAQDADPQRPEPLRDGDLKVAQNSPL